MASTLKGLRCLTSELRHTFAPGTKLRDTRITQYVLNQYRKNQTTEKQHCKAAQEMTYLADSYATYLQSQRKWKELTDEYQNKPDLNVRQTADRIGFRLPQDPTIKK